jgi:predicted glycogen debranching enzyme
MAIVLDKSVRRDLDQAPGREWLETNGLGGWASSTVSGAHSRKYHGMLVAATQPPVGCMVMLSKLDESLIVNGKRFELGANCYPDAIYPRGYLYLDSCRWQRRDEEEVRRYQ